MSATPAPVQPRQPDRVGLVFLGGYFLLLCGLTVGTTAGWHAYRERVESSWPAVAAHLSDCRVRTSYDSWHGRARSLHHVECSFRYEVGATAHVVNAKVGDTLSVVPGQIDLFRPTVTLSSLQRWVRRHPNGSVETIHHDPSHPERISLVGVDDDVKWQTTWGYVRGAVTFCTAGVGLLALGLVLRRAASRRIPGAA